MDSTKNDWFLDGDIWVNRAGDKWMYIKVHKENLIPLLDLVNCRMNIDFVGTLSVIGG